MKNLLSILLIIGSFSLCSISKAQAPNNNSINNFYGVSLCGAEFGETNMPGILNRHYTYPNSSEITYFASKGTRVIQLPFKWERIQRTLGGNLDLNEMSYISKFIDDCAAKNVMVVLVMQNFGRYRIGDQELVLGSYDLPNVYFYDVWKKLAFALKNKTNIYAFTIMAEPHDMGYNKWFLAAQQGINGVREYNKNVSIIVDGDNYSNPESWVRYNDYLKFLKDPSNNLMFSAHCYFDEDRSGRYARPYELSGANTMTGVERVKHFIEWCNANNKKAFIGEFGVPKNDDRWLAVLDNFLNYLSENNIGGCYWAAGPWWKNYSLSIEPVNNTDQPQMNVYAKYLNIGFFNGNATASLQKVKTVTASTR